MYNGQFSTMEVDLIYLLFVGCLYLKITNTGTIHDRLLPTQYVNVGRPLIIYIQKNLFD